MKTEEDGGKKKEKEGECGVGEEEGGGNER
jgi:hypothetical protein